MVDRGENATIEFRTGNRQQIYTRCIYALWIGRDARVLDASHCQDAVATAEANADATADMTVGPNADATTTIISEAI